MEQRINLKETKAGFWDGLLKSGQYLNKSGLSHQIMELVKYRVSQINGCAFCLDMHHKDAISMGETELRLHTLAAWREAPFYTEQERVALAYTEALTMISGHGVSDELYNALLQHFDKATLADLTLCIANTNSWNRINIAFRREPGKYEPGQFK